MSEMRINWRVSNKRFPPAESHLLGRAAADGFYCCGALILQIGPLFSLSFCHYESLLTVKI